MRGRCVVGVVDSCHRGSIAGFTFWVCVLELVLVHWCCLLFTV